MTDKPPEFRDPAHLGRGIPDLYWWQRLDLQTVAAGVCLLLVALALPGISGSGRNLDHAGNLVRFLGRFFPPDLTVLPDLGPALLETSRIAVVATCAATMLSLPLALGATRRISPWWVVVPVRGLLNLIRTIPSLIWALLAVAVTGANPLAGTIALTGYSIGYMAKFFAEAIDAADQSTVTSLRALGADRVQAFRWGLWPEIRPVLASHSLWMLEYNLRSATIIGYVGAGGIGMQLHTYQEYAQWDRFCAVLLVILVVVTILDLVGSWMRRRLIG